jgi:benzoyl-CoA reductase/2-hydroxyglutaryl-CoA dehydratase subunit BcrC/BadD/HgdB
VVGCVGSDVPLEMVIAAGLRPVRLWADPAAPTPLADAYLGHAEPEARALLDALAGGAFGPLRGLLIGHNTEGLVRLHYALQALKRQSPDAAPGAPEPYLHDLLHMPRRSTQAYNGTRTLELADQLAAWSGRPFDAAALRAATAVCNRTRRLLHTLRALREVGRLSGLQALKAFGAGATLSPKAHQDLLAALVEDADTLPIYKGRRLFLTGSGHDNPQVYRLIEAAGGLIVGEDHDWGDLLGEDLVDETADDPVDALVERYQYRAPSGSKFPVAERAAYTARRAREAGAEAVVAFIRKGDPGPRWDVPAQREALGAVPLLLLEAQPYRILDEAGFQAQLGALIAETTP